MKQLTGRYRGSFLSRAGVVLGGSMLGQAIAFLMLPFAARIYNADMLGRAATVLAVVGILSLVVCLQYDQAVIVAADADLPYLALLSLLVALAFSIALGGIVAIDVLLSYTGGVRSLQMLGADWTLPLLLLSYALYSILTNLSLRRNDLARVSLGRVIYYGGSAVLQVVCGFSFGPSASTFLLAQLLASLVAVLYLLPLRSIRRFMARQGDVASTWHGLRRVSRTYVNFPKFQMGAGFANAVSAYLPIWIMRVAFSEAWAGWFYMAWRLLASPMNLVSQAIGQVFYRDSAERNRDGADQGRYLERVVLGLLRLGTLPCLGLAVGAPFLVEVFLGPDWRSVGTIVQLLLISMVVVFFTSPVSSYLNVVGKQSGALAYNLALLALRSIGLLAGCLLHSPQGAVFGYSLATLSVFLPFIRYVLLAANGSFAAVIRRARYLLVDAAVVLLLVVVLSLGNALYDVGGLAIILVVLVIVAWRDWRRGGWGLATDQPRTSGAA